MLTMKMKQFIAKVIVTIFIATVCVSNTPMTNKTAEAAASDGSYLNAVIKYLELGVTGKESFDFNIRKGSYAPGDELYWYIRSGKGTPECITIDHKTGVVTAKRAGTAYIRCRITSSGEVVARPEAKVTVYNKITKVEINNLPAVLTIPAGQTADFNRTILSTAAGMNTESNGITRWEIAEDTAGVDEVSDHGRVLPIQAGAFKIRAVCFKNQTDYQLWRMNKEKKSSNITAASDWSTVQVSDSSGIGYVTNQKELDKLLKAPGITYIICDTNYFTDITIPDSDYNNKTLIFDTPEPAEATLATAKTDEIKSFAEPTYYLGGKDVKVAEDLKLQGIADGRLSPEYFTSGCQAMIILSRLLGEEAKAKSQYPAGDQAVGNDKNTGAINLMFGKGLSADVSSISEQFYKIILTALGYQPGTDFEFIASTPFTADILANASIRLLPGSEGSFISVPTALLDKLLINNQSRGEATLLVDKLKLAIGSGMMTPDKIHQAIQNANLPPELESFTKLNPVPVGDITCTYIKKSQAVVNSILSGTFQYNGQPVSGSFTWNEPTLALMSNQTCSWTFTPEDTTTYSKVIGTAMVYVKTKDQILTEVQELIQNMPFKPLTDESKTSVVLVQSAIREVMRQELAAYKSVINITVDYESREYTTNITCDDKEVNINVTNKFFDDQDTSITILPEGTQYIKSVSGSAITVVSGSAISLLQNSYIVQGESGFLIPAITPPDTYPEPTDLVTTDMCIDVFARDNKTKKRYTIIIQE